MMQKHDFCAFDAMVYERRVRQRNTNKPFIMKGKLITFLPLFLQ